MGLSLTYSMAEPTDHSAINSENNKDIDPVPESASENKDDPVESVPLEPKFFNIVVKSPKGTETTLQISLADNVQDIKQFLFESKDLCHITSYALLFNGTPINNFAELKDIEGLEEGSVLIMEERPYTQFDSRLHVNKLRELLAERTERPFSLLSSLTTQLEEEMAKFQTDINTEVDAVLQRTQYTIKNRTKEPVNLDDLANPEDDLPAPLLPTSHTETTSIEPKKEPFNPTLEDYLSTSDSMSLLSLDMSSNAGAPLVEQHETSMTSSSEANLSSYIGFSAQSSAIPSISCDSALKAKKTSSSSAENVVSTASSSPMMSAPTSPDDEDLVTPKISSSSESEEDNGPTAAKVLSGIFETFDNLL